MTSIASTAPITIMIITIAMMPYMSVVFEANPVSGVDDGAVVGAATVIAKADSADDPQ